MGFFGFWKVEFEIRKICGVSLTLHFLAHCYWYTAWSLNQEVWRVSRIWAVFIVWNVCGPGQESSSLCERTSLNIVASAVWRGKEPKVKQFWLHFLKLLRRLSVCLETVTSINNPSNLAHSQYLSMEKREKHVQ